MLGESLSVPQSMVAMHGPRSCSDDDHECEKQQGECDSDIEDEEGDDDALN